MGNGITVGKVTGGNQGIVYSAGKGKGNSGSSHGQRPQDDCTSQLTNPFKGASSNPFDLYGRVSGFISKLLGAETCVENQWTDSILNPSSKANPNFLMIAKFKIMALLGRMYDYLKYLTQVVKADREATKDAYQVGFA